MRKHYYTILACIIAPVLAFAQLPPKDDGTGKYTFQGVVQASKLSASEVLECVTKYGKNETNTTGKENTWEVEESSGSMIKFKCTMTVTYPGTKGGTSLKGQIAFSVRVDAKEGKFRYIITDFVHSEARGSGGKLELSTPECGSTKLSPTSWKKIKGLTTTQINKLIVDIKRIVKEFENDPARNDDW